MIQNLILVHVVKTEYGNMSLQATIYDWIRKHCRNLGNFFTRQ